PEMYGPTAPSRPRVRRPGVCAHRLRADTAGRDAGRVAQAAVAGPHRPAAARRSRRVARRLAGLGGEPSRPGAAGTGPRRTGPAAAVTRTGRPGRRPRVPGPTRTRAPASRAPAAGRRTPRPR